MFNVTPFIPSDDDFYNKVSDCSIIPPDEFINYFSNQSSSYFSIIHLNIRSCRQNFASFHLILSSLLFKFSIVALTETWLTKDIDLLFELDNYKNFNQYRTSHGGGIKVFIWDSIEVNILSEYCVTKDLYESVACEVFLSGIKYIFCCIYRPPGEKINDFCKEFELSFLNKIPRNSKVLLCGDFNINLYNPLKLNSINCFISLMLEYNYLSHINYPTKHNPNNIITTYSLIDQIWTNFVPTKPKSGVIEMIISDHLPIFLSFSFKLRRMDSFVSYRIFSKQNFDKLIFNFNKLDFGKIYQSDNVDANFDYFYDKIYSAYNSSFPIIRKKKKPKDRSAWITIELKYCIKKKYKLLKLLKDNYITLEIFNSYKKLLNSAIKQAKSLYYLKKSFKFNGNVKKTWDFVNDLLNSNDREPISSITNSNSVALKENDMVNYFNSYFINVISELTINNPNNFHDDVLYSVNDNPNSFFFISATEHEMENIIFYLESKPVNLKDISIDALKALSKPLSKLISFFIIIV